MERKGTRELFLETLKAIGCLYQIDNKDQRIYFDFQGEHFQADASDSAYFVVVYDPFWGSLGLNDIDEVSRLRKAINHSNLNHSTMAVFTIDQERKTMDVHSKSNILFIPEIPQIGQYLHAMLSKFFEVHRTISAEMDRLRREEEKVASD